MTISRPLPRATPEAAASSPLWKRVLATLVSVFVPGAGLVWADRFSSGWRWWLVVSFSLVPVMLLANVAPAWNVAAAWVYQVLAVLLLSVQLVVTWRTEATIPQDAIPGPALAVWVSFPPGSWWPRWERIGVEP